MKKIKISKLVSSIMALAMMLCLATTSIHAKGNADITVNNTSEGTKLEAYKILDYNYDAKTKTYNSVSFEDAGYKQIFVDAINDATIDSNSTDAEIMTYITTNLNANENDFVKALGKALKDYIEVKENGITATRSLTAEGTSVIFTGLDVGYYLILDATEYDKDTTIDKAEVAVMVKALGENVDVYLKTSTYTKGKKEVSETNVEIGQKITYTLTFDIPNFSKYADDADFVITDTMQSGLTFNNDATYTLPKSDGTINEGKVTDLNGTEVASTGGETTFTIPVRTNFTNEDVGKTFTITYTATMNKNASIDNLGNTVAFQQNGHDLPSDNAIVYSYGIKVLKVNEKGDKLEGVGFVLTNEEENLYYTFDENLKYSGTVDKLIDATTLTTDEIGEITVFGLKAGTYYLKETKPLGGYNKLEKNEKVDIPETTGEKYNEDTAYVTVEVENVTGIILPSTGGIGTTVFRATGGAVVLIAGAFLLLNRKKIFC